VTTAIDTKTRILDTAEQLFADNGFTATSLRTITTEAGVNLAAVNYHFGSKEALLAEVLGRRFRPINQERLELLDALEAEVGESTPSLEPVLRAFLVPAFRALLASGDQGAKFMQLIGRTHSETNEKIQGMFFKLFEGVIQRFTEAFHGALPELSVDEVKLRMLFVIGAMAHTLALSHKVPWLSEKIHHQSASGEVLENLIQFAAEGMRAPVPALEQGRVQ
jgi:AcrR family transcriptional regulator